MKNTIGKLFQAFADELANFQAFVTLFLNESIPGLAVELLPEWEADLGLPDECSKEIQTIVERQTAVHAKHTANYSGQHKQFYIDYAAALGINIAVQESFNNRAFFRVDKSRVDRTQADGIDGARVYGVTAVFRWKVTFNTDGSVSQEYLKCKERHRIY